MANPPIDSPRLSPSGPAVAGGTPPEDISFLDLTDTPNTYAGASDQFVRVNTAADGLEFDNFFDVVSGPLTILSYDNGISNVSSASMYGFRVGNMIVVNFAIGVTFSTGDSPEFPKTLKFTDSLFANNGSVSGAAAFSTATDTALEDAIPVLGQVNFDNSVTLDMSSAIPNGTGTIRGSLIIRANI